MVRFSRLSLFSLRQYQNSISYVFETTYELWLMNDAINILVRFLFLKHIFNTNI